MKKILLPLFLVVVFCAGFCFGCGNSNAVKLNKKYYINKIYFMGFSGNRSDIQTYIDSQDSVEEINAFSDYLYFAMQIQVEFNSKKNGTLTIPKVAATFNSYGTEAQNVITDAKEVGLINGDGDFVVSFDYENENNFVIIKTVHTKIISSENNGDMSFQDAISKLISYIKDDDSKKDVKITNSDCNILKLKKGKMQMTLSFEFKSDVAKENPDIATDLLLTFAK